MNVGENIYQRKDGRFEGRYHKGRKSNGRIQYGYVYGKTISEVRMKLYPLKEKYMQLRNLQGETSMSFEEWGQLWLKEAKKVVKPSTLASYSYKLTKYLFPEIGQIALNELNLVAVEQMMNRLLMRLSAATVRVVCHLAKSILNRAIEKQLLRQNPFAALKFPRTQKTKVHALRKKEQDQLELAAKAADTKGLPTLIALYTGLRIGELAALKWSDINFEDNVMEISSTLQRIPLPRQKNKTQIICQEAKTQSSIRVIPFGKKIRQLLVAHKLKSSHDYVFATEKGPYEPRLLTYHFHKIRDEAGLGNIHFHQLRHTFATRCLEKQSDISSVSALLGHASTQMTLDIYADNLLEQRYKVMELLDSCI